MGLPGSSQEVVTEEGVWGEAGLFSDARLRSPVAVSQARLTSKQALGMSKITGLGKELLHKGRSPPTHGCLYTTPSAFVHRVHHMEAGSWEVDQPLLPLAEGVEQQG